MPLTVGGEVFAPSCVCVVLNLGKKLECTLSYCTAEEELRRVLQTLETTVQL